MIDYSSCITCQECGQVHRYSPVAVGKVAACQRCGGILYRNRANMLESVLALTLAGLVLFILSNVFPLLGFRAQVGGLELHLLGASVVFWGQGYPLLAMLLVLNTFIFPLFELLSLLVVLLTIRFRWKPSMALFLFHWMQELKPWGMLEVFMLGILVSMVKLNSMATIIVGEAFWSFAGLILVMAAATAALDPFTVWRKLGVDPPQRKVRANSIEVTWALLIAAIILYIPANTLPIMSAYKLGTGSPDTIVSGVFRLLNSGQWPLALVVFIASVVIPLMKLITLTFLLISIQFQSRWRQSDRMRLYKVIEYVGRWSMVDVFVIAILVGLVQFGTFARVEANIGSISFAAVVVLTMFAARTLDAHLIWDTSPRGGKHA
jgi:paraquat-inducible protein A